MRPWATSTRRSRLPADWEKRRQQVKDRAGGQCEAINADGRCRRQGSECDHRTAGDDHSLGNLQWLCWPHHREKTLAEAAAGRRKASRKRPPERHPGVLPEDSPVRRT